MNTESLLTVTLELAVPLWQMKLKNMPWSEALAGIKGASDLIGSKGDILQFGGGKKGEVAKVLNKMAEAIAVLSFLPGGVTLFGQHWEDQHPERAYPVQKSNEVGSACSVSECKG